MSLTINLPPTIEEAYRAEARANGVPVGDFVRDILVARKSVSTEKLTVFEQGLGLFSSPEDAALLDEAVALAYEERRRPPKSVF